MVVAFSECWLMFLSHVINKCIILSINCMNTIRFINTLGQKLFFPLPLYEVKVCTLIRNYIGEAVVFSYAFGPMYANFQQKISKDTTVECLWTG